MRATHKAVTMAVAVLTVITIGTGPASAKRGGTVNSKADLTSSGVDGDARGVARLQVKHSSDGKFELQVKKLDRNATYEVLADGVRVGSIATNGGGNGKIRFRSRPRSSKDVLLGFDPRGAVVTVVNAAGETVLSVTLTDDDDDAGKIVCCIPDDSGTECEDRTVAACGAQGGTVSTAASCLPNPCADVPPGPGADVVCCLPDDSGPECEDRTSAECAAQGGVVVSATSCAANPCAPITPPATGDDNGGGTEPGDDNGGHGGGSDDGPGHH